MKVASLCIHISFKKWILLTTIPVTFKKFKFRYYSLKLNGTISNALNT